MGHYSATKNAATSAKVNGVKSNEKAANFRGNDTPKRHRNAMSKFAAPAHKSVARMIGYALTLGTEAAWWGFCQVIMARLTVKERASLAFMALRSLDDDTAYSAASAALFGTVDGEVVA